MLFMVGVLPDLVNPVNLEILSKSFTGLQDLQDLQDRVSYDPSLLNHPL